MRLGYYTDYSEETAAFAHETGFTSLELSAWPDSAINPDTVSEARLEAILADLQRRDLEISSSATKLPRTRRRRARRKPPLFPRRARPRAAHGRARRQHIRRA